MAAAVLMLHWFYSTTKKAFQFAGAIMVQHGRY